MRATCSTGPCLSKASPAHPASRALQKLPGVAEATVNLATESASVHADASVSLAALQSAVEKAGYTVGESSVSLAIDGMNCASCVSRVEKALMRVPGVVRAEVNLATESATVTASTRHIDEAALVTAVERAGYLARPRHPDAEGGQRPRRDEHPIGGPWP